MKRKGKNPKKIPMKKPKAIDNSELSEESNFNKETTDIESRKEKIEEKAHINQKKEDLTEDDKDSSLTLNEKADINQKKEDVTEDKKNSSLTLEEKARIELNRQRALMIRQEKLNKQRIHQNVEEKAPKSKVIRINDSKLLDTGGGFFIEQEKTDEITDVDIEIARQIVADPPPLFKEDHPFCEECSQPFDNSYLNHNFKEPVCDNCRDVDDKHSLITKTDAKTNYLLKDTDIEKRDPPLQFILKKNPHNSRWGDMKLYLKLQVERRALEVWGSEEALEDALEKHVEKREVTRKRKFMKKMKELRMDVRSSLYTRATKNHEHEYGEEVYHSDDDEYSKTCQTCGHSYRYDKM